MSDVAAVSGHAFAQFTAWGDKSRKKLTANIAHSTATWKTVNRQPPTTR
ncbi:hypothetical protein PF005_g18857 [Phytophthora fragariae]|uniref:Uncharacterized protein n=1 Tax=Phytophthora fragariae TaxID=53985 RepID=A0A6A3Y093_9STRA|nr:hypothetical protein PF003_g25572 [Phytophthora fragariae]KAE9091833.1 hypothetical protein PF010_g18035 [Phytophthora fragariae]KAE9191408.1 hypothetical protein PF005_g18857 [Phytophthora fragariae]KAE9208801.1 hypothetical protein PF002_g19295 [Phytophthora fragariae]KAE9293801.1 hypothetical protein PF001_g18085 [Phytophthora fragariae]